jgi:hypothetical protein
MRAPAAIKVSRIFFLLLPNDFTHSIAGIRDDLFDLRIAESLSRFYRDRNKFLGQIVELLELLAKKDFSSERRDGSRCSGANHRFDLS